VVRSEDAGVVRSEDAGVARKGGCRCGEASSVRNLYKGIIDVDQDS
jgi:hypothetical protein